MKLYKLMRTLHIISSLALLPWMLVYATSAFFLNHGEWFNDGPRGFELVRVSDLSGGGPLPAEPWAKADEIVRRLGLGGPCYLPRGQAPQGLTIVRPSAAGTYQIIWHEQQQAAMVLRQSFSLRALVNQLHFSHGYGRGHAALTAWAVIVDVFVLSIVMWVVSGIYLWAARGGKKQTGWVSLGAGAFVFVVLVWLLAR